MNRQAARRKYHYIYKITRNDGSDKYYIGMHSTDDLEDGYFGSGKIITASIKKHGKEKHNKEILEFLPTREALKLREKKLVTEELIADKLCMNLKLGGEGGGKFKDKAHQQKCSNAALASLKKRLIIDPTYGKVKAAHLKSFVGWKNTPRFAGKSHSQETKDKMSRSMIGKQTGEKNSQYGTCWVNDGLKSIRIKRTELQNYTQNGFVIGRKF
jgi:hypothetical protein